MGKSRESVLDRGPCVTSKQIDPSVVVYLCLCTHMSGERTEVAAAPARSENQQLGSDLP